MTIRVQRRLASMLALFAVLCMVLGASQGSSLAQSSPDQELAERFAPIVMLREQKADCDKDGEGYFPAPVDFLFDNPDIKLVANTGGDKSDDVVLQEGFTPQDLAAAGPDTYLDFPGNPRDPGCAYEQYFKQKVAELGIEPTTYARIVVDSVARRLYIQYWFYYYFNDWNNTHESDWEMLWVGFEGTTSAEEALDLVPSTVGYAQHGGGETGSWTAGKLQKSGDRVIAFPSAGSHATYYSQDTYIGWGTNGTAFGCDNTEAPSTENPLNVILVPEVIDPNSDLAFFLYEGNWGERDFAVYEGPKGPNMGGKWNDPVAATEDWRDSTLLVPDSSFGGVSTTDLFCTASEYGSKVFTFFGSHPWATGLAILAVLAIIGFLLYVVWQYLMEAIDIYGNELRTFLGIGLLALPLGLLGAIVSEYLKDYEPLKTVSSSFNGSSSGNLAISLAVGSLSQLTMVLLITPACIYAMKDIRRGIKPGTWRSYRGAIRSLPLTVPVVIIFALVSMAMALTIVLVPFGLYVLLRILFSFHAGILDDRLPFTRAVEASWDVTRRKWLKTLIGTGIFQLLILVPGPLVGVIVLIIGGSKVGFANFLSGFVYALTIPLATIGITMIYHRLAGHDIVEPEIVTRELAETKAEAHRDWIAEPAD